MSLMVTYTRARAEALGVECKVGLATRPVRVVILSAGLLFAKGASLGDFELLEPAIYVMAIAHDLHHATARGAREDESSTSSTRPDSARFLGNNRGCVGR